MTFSEIQSRVAERLNITSSEGLARIGRYINDRYRRVTTAIGLQVARRVNVQQNATLGVRYLTFSGIEKVISVQDRSSGSLRTLDEVTVEEIDASSVGDGQPTAYAIYNMGAGSVTIYLNVNPQTEFTLYAEGHDRAETLSGANEPAFSESFHDVLVFGAIADELRKLEKTQLARDAEADFERRLQDLQMWVAKSAFQTIYQGKNRTSTAFGAGSGSGSAVSGATSYTQTGLITFDRDPLAPFAVTASSAKVDNLDADKLDGEDGSAYHNASNLNAGTVPLARISGITNTQIDNAAAIAYSKLNLASSIVNADVANAAAIGWSKLSKTGSSLADLATRSASDLSSGTVSTARLGSGTASVETFLRGDQTWAAAFALVCQGRLTLTTAVPVTVSDVTAAGTIYFAPYGGNRIALYNGTNWQLYTFTERSLALSLTSAKNYDVFLYDNAGTLTLELSAAWTNDTTRADALTTQDGVLVKSGATTRRYLGTIRASGSNTTEDSFAKRFVWNYYNRVPRTMRVLEATNTWTYTTATYRQANAATTNQLALVIGWAEVELDAEVHAQYTNDGTTTNGFVAIGEDSTTTKHASCINTWNKCSVANSFHSTTARLRLFPTVGYHFYVWLEQSTAAGTTTWLGDNGGVTTQSGIHGSILG